MWYFKTSSWLKGIRKVTFFYSGSEEQITKANSKAQPQIRKHNKSQCITKLNNWQNVR